MKINILCIGKIKESYLVEAISEYSKRLSKYVDLNIIELSEEKMGDNPSEKEILDVKNKEASRLASQINEKDYVIALNLNKKELTSEEFASKINEVRMARFSVIDFVIGGSYGLGEEVLKKAQFQLSFSKMTFPHQLFRVILLEQIYRAFKILSNETYHK